MANKSAISGFVKSLLFCAGADLHTLERCSKRTISKRAALGALVLTPAAMALVSSYCFLITIFKADVLAATSGCLLWSLVVFNIDRYLIATYEKGSSSKKAAMCIPVMARLFLAGFIGYTISHPMVLRLFNDNIQEHLIARQLEKKNGIIERYNQTIRDAEKEIDRLGKELSGKLDIAKEPNTYEDEIRSLEDEINKQYDFLADEIAGRSKRTGKYGDGPVAETIRNKIEYLQRQLDQLKQGKESNVAMRRAVLEAQWKGMEELSRRNTELIRDKRDQIARTQRLMENELKTFEDNTANDFLTRSNVLDELAAKHFNVMKWSSLLAGIFILVDVLPVVFKIVTRIDEYDLKIETDRMVSETEEQIKRNILTRTKDGREKIEFQKWHYALLEKEMEQMAGHRIALLNRFTLFFDQKKKHDLSLARSADTFMQAIEEVRTEDYKAGLSRKVREEAADYFSRSGEISREALRMMSSNDSRSRDI